MKTSIIAVAIIAATFATQSAVAYNDSAEARFRARIEPVCGLSVSRSGEIEFMEDGVDVFNPNGDATKAVHVNVSNNITGTESNLSWDFRDTSSFKFTPHTAYATESSPSYDFNVYNEGETVVLDQEQKDLHIRTFYSKRENIVGSGDIELVVDVTLECR